MFLCLNYLDLYSWKSGSLNIIRKGRYLSRKKSYKLFERAKTLMPGGVNSPARAWGSVGGSPIVLDNGKGSRINDIDGNTYIDYVCSWGPMILGHAHDEILNAANKAMNNGTSFGAPTKLEITMAEMVVDAISSIEMVRFVNSGTEAVMSALRLARAHTGRNLILKFDVRCVTPALTGVLF